MFCGEGITDKGKLENMKHSHVFMRFPGGKAKAVTFSFDDGVVEDAWMVEMLKKYHMGGTFNINAGLCTHDPTDYEKVNSDYLPDKSIQERFTRKEMCRIFEGSGMEIASHGYTHAQLDKIDTAAAMWEICRDRAELEQITGVPVRGFAYPQGGVNDDIVTFLKQCGFLYARHAQSTYAFDMPADPYMIQPTCHFLEEQVSALAKAFVERKITTGVLQKNTEPALFYIWGHSYELRRKGEEDYKKTETLLEYLSGREDVWYPTNLQLFEYKKAFDELVYGIDRTFAQNMSCIPLWVFANGKTVRLDPGAVVPL
ncbi:MAG: polysaccharide deacetylase family protein [Clostridiales bacterium]|nr:polysaccharide deacetylase family protein [Clostridiales bacterium]